MSVLRVFSYLPNPRVWKAQIAADICGVEIEVVGDAGGNLGQWLWDFDAHPLPEAERTEASPHARIGRRGFSGTLFKTDAFLEAHPFGTVPAAFSPDGSVGIFESNSILRAVARAAEDDHGLYGADAYGASRIDSFLDADVVFGREAQVYLLGMGTMTAALHERMAAAYEFYLNGVETALVSSPYVAGDDLTIADIAFACGVAQFLREGKGRFRTALADVDLEPIGDTGPATYPRAFGHLFDLAERSPFDRYLPEYLDWYRQSPAARAG